MEEDNKVLPKAGKTLFFITYFSFLVISVSQIPHNIVYIK